jgi:hypothetical protein
LRKIGLHEQSSASSERLIIPSKIKDSLKSKRVSSANIGEYGDADNEDRLNGEELIRNFREGSSSRKRLGDGGFLYPRPCGAGSLR